MSDEQLAKLSALGRVKFEKVTEIPIRNFVKALTQKAIRLGKTAHLTKRQAERLDQFYTWYCEDKKDV